jgi:hypothetical protein
MILPRNHAPGRNLLYHTGLQSYQGPNDLNSAITAVVVIPHGKGGVYYVASHICKLAYRSVILTSQKRFNNVLGVHRLTTVSFR